MTVVKSLAAKLSLEKSLLFAGVSKTVWYYSKRTKKKYSTKPCGISDSPNGWAGGGGGWHQHATCKTRKMAAAASRKLNGSEWKADSQNLSQTGLDCLEK